MFAFFSIREAPKCINPYKNQIHPSLIYLSIYSKTLSRKLLFNLEYLVFNDVAEILQCIEGIFL